MIVQLIQASWDVAVDDQEHPTTVQLSLKSSKTDPFRRGVHIVIGSTQDDLCPVATLLAYFAVRGGGGNGGQPCPLFRLMSGLPLPHPEFVSRVKAVVATSPSPLGQLCAHVAKPHTEGREGLALQHIYPEFQLHLPVDR